MPYTAPYTGWRSLLQIGSTDYLRFVSETINIPLAITVNDDMHAGIRTASTYEYGLVIPDGTIETVLISDTTSAFVTTVNSILKTLLTNAISATPAVGNDVYLYRGDISKFIEAPWIKSITIAGSSGQKVTVSIGLRGIYGDVSTSRTYPTVTSLGLGRPIMFNELTWADLPLLTSTELGNTLVPRSFSLTIDNGLIDDDSYNSANPRALRGFAAGMMSISGEITAVGGATNSSPVKHANDTSVGTGEGNFIPWNETFSFGGIYTVKDGIWIERTLNAPGTKEINVVNLSFRGLYSLAEAGGDTDVMPIAVGTLLT